MSVQRNHLLVVLLVASIPMAGVQISVATENVVEGVEEQEALVDDPSPSPELSPEQVVRIQLQALRGNDESDRGIAICFRFASPANKANTGPLSRFARMIKDGGYRLMLEYRHIDYEPVQIADDVARQRVTLIGSTTSITYVFYLSKQSQPDCDGCWMTDAVSVERVEDGVVYLPSRSG